MAGRDSQEPRTVLEYLLRTQDRTYEEIVREFEKQARKLDEPGMTISARHLRRLASGERVGTTPATRRILQALFGQPIGELLSPWNRGESASGPAGPVPRIHSDVELLAMAAERSRDFSLRMHVASGGEEIDRLTDEVRELSLIFQRTPVPMILGRLVSVQDTVLASLDVRQRPSNARQLYFLASIVAGMLAHAGNDLGKPRLALSHARSAYLWAGYTDHNGLRAWARGIQSYLCYWANQPREAIRYANAGAEFAASARGTAPAWLFASEARAWSSLGDVERCRAAIESAADAHERAQPDDLDEFGGPCTFGRSKRHYYVARSLAMLPGEGVAAERYSVQAVDAYADENHPDWDYSCQADSRLSLALARLANRELDGALISLRPVLEIPPEQRSHDLVQTINVVHRSLNHFRTDAWARELQEEIEIFTRASLSSLPS